MESVYVDDIVELVYIMYYDYALGDSYCTKQVEWWYLLSYPQAADFPLSMRGSVESSPT